MYSQQERDIYINVEKLWKSSIKMKHPIDYFIREFTDTFDHEIIHWLIRVKLKNDYSQYHLGEEKIVYNLLGHKWTKLLEKFYRNMKRDNDKSC